MSRSAILCVDDEIAVLSSLKEQLRRRFGDRYLYETAASAEEAWALIDELAEDGIGILMIISDWLMPGVKGDEFLAQVHDAHPTVMTVMLTGQVEPLAIERAQREANLLACIHKPWNEGELLDLVGASLG
ncbi:MAG: response regulator [Rhodocyclaceae bacterium]|nr:response regulator [Rhodocyclaceae bacterium]